MRDSVRPGPQAAEWTALIDRPHTYNLQSHTPHRPPAAAVSPIHLNLAGWVTEELEQLTAAAAARGHGG